MNRCTGLSLVALSLLATSGCGNAVEARSPATVASSECAARGKYVPAGGTAGFDTLVDADFTPQLRATGRVRLYEHSTAIANAISGSPASNPYKILHAIEDVFRESGPGEAELGMVGPNYFTLPAKTYPGFYQYQYVKSGLRPNAADVDVPYKTPNTWHYTKANVDAWKAWADAGKSAGITSMAPIVAPNVAWQPHNPLFPPTRAAYYDINSEYYKLWRFESTYGGAIAFDTPSDFFTSGGSGAGYQTFIEEAIRWGNASGLRTTVLISPVNRRVFSAATRKYVGILVAHGSVPSEWAVDDYENADPNNAAAMGPETVANTTTQVALWLATNAPVYIQGRVCRP